jgi:hypothetical protein
MGPIFKMRLDIFEMRFVDPAEPVLTKIIHSVSGQPQQSAILVDRYFFAQMDTFLFQRCALPMLANAGQPRFYFSNCEDELRAGITPVQLGKERGDGQIGGGIAVGQAIFVKIAAEPCTQAAHDTEVFYVMSCSQSTLSQSPNQTFGARLGKPDAEYFALHWSSACSVLREDHLNQVWGMNGYAACRRACLRMNSYAARLRSSGGFCPMMVAPGPSTVYFWP